MPETDSVDTLAADLSTDPSLTNSQRRSIVDEMSNWMFTRPVAVNGLIIWQAWIWTP